MLLGGNVAMKFYALLIASMFGIQLQASQHIIVSIPKQELSLISDNRTIKTYPISTSGYGISNAPDSNHTPLGKHIVRAKIGDGAPIGTIFKGGVKTSKKAAILSEPVPKAEQKDDITTRILQLKGTEPRNSNSEKRGIWVHGSPYEGNIGMPCSHGCVRMKNNDIIDLFDRIKVGCELIIVNK